MYGMGRSGKKLEVKGIDILMSNYFGAGVVLSSPLLPPN